MEKLDLKTLLFFVILSTTGGGSGALLLDRWFPPREDPFTGVDGVRLEVKLRQLIGDTEDRIRYDMPPELTRARIIALEKEVEANHIGFEPPSALFSERQYPPFP